MLPTIPNPTYLDTCLNGSTGWISASATGGSPVNTLSASIQSGSTIIGPYPLVGGSYVFAGLNSGSYTVTWEDGSNCTTQSTEVITTPPPVVVSVQAVEADCPNDTGTPNGGIAVNVSGGSGNYNYRWWNGSSFVKFVEDPTGLVAGTYNLFVSDSTGCNSTTSSNIVVNALTVIGFSSASVTSPLCYSGDNGSILGGVLSGGSGSLVPTWNGPSGFTSNSLNIINLASGNYYLTASDTLTGCYHIFGPYTITTPAEFKSSSFSYTSSVGATGINTFNAIFTGGTPPYTASLYLSASGTGLTFVTSSSSMGTVSMVPNMCYTESTYWTLDAYDNNGCHMTNFMSGAQLYVPTQVTAQNVVCYSSIPDDPLLCGCESEEYVTFYISSSDTTNPSALFNEYMDLFNDGIKIYNDCKLSSLATGSYYGNQNVVTFGSGSTAGTIAYFDPCLVPQPKTVTLNIVNTLKTLSTTYVTDTFESLTPEYHVYNLFLFNQTSSIVYTNFQTGYLDIVADVSQALADPGYITITVDVSINGMIPYTSYVNCAVGTSTVFFASGANGIFIDSDSNYVVTVTYAAGSGPNCAIVGP